MLVRKYVDASILGSMRVAIYCRVSTKDKGQNTASQLLQLQQFCTRQDWTVVQVYEEEVSGRKGERDREALRQVFADASKRKWDCLLFWSLDRLTRQGAFATLKYLSRLSELGIDYRSYTEEYVSTMGVFSDVIVSLLATLAKQEAIRVSERTKSGLDRARSQGRGGGRPRASVSKEQVVRLHQAGKSLNVIANELGVGKSTVHRLLQQSNPKRGDGMKRAVEKGDFDTSGDLEDAIDAWLTAREEWLTGVGREKLDRFTAATNVLYAAFAQDWQGDERTLPEAFEQFKKALIEDESVGYRHLEVSVAYPHLPK